ncbi:hypothetical protein NF27_BF00040 [Candidatus Jidaibacter acanthamoeba]|uniref:Uncharacterized protein n=1 Tax=Candidatus Jidaibacter acanthamoebae TaxID=86105 RepID=A0A0C1MVG2_9RICK|nr:ankyrin repeat domain-containing protein [Candidatus Jidaibacter acanthamoeba]KIE06202.1 hypothetical protein NF27_BF00040 [Candidatus Jidaibacter acanthamoeba]
MLDTTGLKEAIIRTKDVNEVKRIVESIKQQTKDYLEQNADKESLKKPGVREQAAQLMLSDTFNIVCNPKTGETFLHITSKMMDVELSEVILEAAANPNAIDNDGNSPLHAIAKNYEKLLFSTINTTREGEKEYVDSLNIESKERYFNGAPECLLNDFAPSIGLLIGRGANLNARNNAGKTALEHIHQATETITGKKCELNLESKLFIKAYDNYSKEHSDKSFQNKVIASKQKEKNGCCIMM